jgi:hypothetical protein
MKFRKKPVVIEAFQWMGSIEQSQVPEWFSIGPDGVCAAALSQSRELLISTLEGVMAAKEGDWIIKGISGEFYPCKPDIFAKTYDPAE